MKIFKALFATAKRAAVSSVCIAVLLALLGAGAAFAVEAIAEKNSIGKPAAEEIALADAGVPAAQAEIRRTKFEFEDGRFVYEVEFVANGKAYEYRLKASDGAVAEKEVKSVSGSAAKAPDAENPPTPPEAQTISADDAKAIALADAGVSAAEARFARTELEKEHGVLFYEVEFATADTEYEYEINAATGEVRSKEVSALREPQPPTPPAPPAEQSAEPTVSEPEVPPAQPQPPAPPAPPSQPEAQTISADDAKAIALADAGVSAADARFARTELEKEHGILFYEIEFTTAAAEYEYEIDAATGEVRSKEVSSLREPQPPTPPAPPAEQSAEPTVSEPEVPPAPPTPPAPPAPSSQPEAQTISADDAKAIALADAGVSAADARFVKTELEKEHGVLFYEVEFATAAAEYEYEIDAATGAILGKEIEARPRPADGQLDANAAKAAALKDAGLAEADVVFTELALETERGVFVYEIEFCSGSTEYEYKIDAVTGAVLEKDVEREDDEEDDDEDDD